MLNAKHGKRRCRARSQNANLTCIKFGTVFCTREVIVDERTSKREVVDMEVIGTSNGKACVALLYDLSMDGCMIDTGGRFALRAGDTIQLELPHAGTTEAALIWTKGRYGGAKFVRRLHQAVVTQLGFRPCSQLDTKFRDQFGRPVTRPGQRFSL